ncbi:hypothetical protein HME9302_00568 [Alteripontixanthobacter maritimus]|uniref:Type VI secretion protein n=1 Tax=Alteripontixanthobacter maritimus TaxID=2161824 RepID=A0A369Q3B9_9SPHN|nr:type IV secretion system protein [Alteripontixanthobacter maritimus]RDC59381.1 hypothetical protein HME9302_00568 [Alteripontixanthobacter maritimus]
MVTPAPTSGTGACSQAMDSVASGVGASLRAVDCMAGETAAAAFSRLFAPGGSLAPVLTILLTLYVAFFAISLLTGRSRLGISALTPRMLTLGLVLTFVTSWVAYQSFVWNLLIGAPDYLASLLTGSEGSATTVFADKIDVVFVAIQQASESTSGSAAGPNGAESTDVSAFSPAGMMWLGAMMLLLGTVGVLVTARIALAVLVALGPVFIVLALFGGTRGLFTGWLKGAVMMALVPLFAVLGGGAMLELAVPIIGALTQNAGQLNPQAAMAFFLVGAVHIALMVMVIKVAATMVAGWTVFGLVPDKVAERQTELLSQPVPVQQANTIAAPVQAAGANAAARRIDIAAIPTGAAANDTSPASTSAGGSATGGGSGGVKREVTMMAAAGGPAPAPTSDLRTRGIGNRFRAAPPRSTEKMR